MEEETKTRAEKTEEVSKWKYPERLQRQWKKIMQKMAERAKNKCDGQETQNSHKKNLMAWMLDYWRTSPKNSTSVNRLESRKQIGLYKITPWNVTGASAIIWTAMPMKSDERYTQRSKIVCSAIFKNSCRFQGRRQIKPSSVIVNCAARHPHTRARVKTGAFRVQP